MTFCLVQGHDDRELQREKESNQVLLAKMRDVELELQAKESECLAAVSHSRMLQVFARKCRFVFKTPLPLT